ncbi:hypothetical protein Tco_0637272 [Tanacetum coccineum]
MDMITNYLDANKLRRKDANKLRCKQAKCFASQCSLESGTWAVYFKSRLYRLEREKDCLIIDRIDHGQWRWNWSRPNLGARNSADLLDMLFEISSVEINEVEDPCVWSAMKMQLAQMFRCLAHVWVDSSNAKMVCVMACEESRVEPIKEKEEKAIEVVATTETEVRNTIKMIVYEDGCLFTSLFGLQES